MEEETRWSRARGRGIAGDPVGSYKDTDADTEWYGEPLEGWTRGIA